MGVYKNIRFDQFPKQGTHLGRRVRVSFNYDTSRYLYGTVVRDDVEGRIAFNDDKIEGLEIFKLDDGRYVLSTECQYQPVAIGEKETPYAAPGSIDDPQSLAYDLANSPYNGLSVQPFEGHLWFQIARDGEWLTTQRCLYNMRLKEDHQRCDELAKCYNGLSLTGFPDIKTGRMQFSGFIMDGEKEPLPGTYKYREAEKARRKSKKARVWEYGMLGDEWFKYPRSETKQGREILEELEHLSNILVTGLAEFQYFLLSAIGMKRVHGSYEGMEISTRVVIVGDQVFFSIPCAPHTGVNLTSNNCYAVNYSDVVLAKEQVAQ